MFRSNLLFFSATEIRCNCSSLSKSVILRPRVKCGKYCAPLDQSDGRYFALQR